MLTYGAFARAVGEQFEKKWLHQAASLTEDVLIVPDFFTTTDLYGVVSNIDNIHVSGIEPGETVAALPIRLLLAHVTGTNLGRVTDPNFMA